MTFLLIVYSKGSGMRRGEKEECAFCVQRKLGICSSIFVRLSATYRALSHFLFLAAFLASCDNRVVIKYASFFTKRVSILTLIDGSFAFDFLINSVTLFSVWGGRKARRHSDTAENAARADARWLNNNLDREYIHSETHCAKTRHVLSNYFIKDRVEEKLPPSSFLWSGK